MKKKRNKKQKDIYLNNFNRDTVANMKDYILTGDSSKIGSYTKRYLDKIMNSYEENKDELVKGYKGKLEEATKDYPHSFIWMNEQVRNNDFRVDYAMEVISRMKRNGSSLKSAARDEIRSLRSKEEKNYDYVMGAIKSFDAYDAWRKATQHKGLQAREFTRSYEDSTKEEEAYVTYTKTGRKIIVFINWSNGSVRFKKF